MCITFFHLFNPSTTNNHNKIRFIIAFNRDQDVNRHTEQFKQFINDKNIYAGRDVMSDGTWLGINIKTGIMVILTNYRLLRKRNAKSRGILVRKFLSSDYIQNPTSVAQLSNKIQQDMRQILKNPTQYSAFNISIYNIRHNMMFYMCSQIDMKQPLVLENNITHGYSNTDINTNWNKVVTGKTMFNQQIIQKLQNTKQIQANNQKNTIIKQKQKVPQINQDKILTNSLILDKMQKIMKNKQGLRWYNKYFQATIFIPLYRSLYFNQRMTKSTFYAIFVQNQKETIQAHIKQVTYNRNGTQSNVQLLLKI